MLHNKLVDFKSNCPEYGTVYSIKICFLLQTYVVPASFFSSTQLWWCVPAHHHLWHSQPHHQHHHHPQWHWGRGRQEVSSWKVQHHFHIPTKTRSVVILYLHFTLHFTFSILLVETFFFVAILVFLCIPKLKIPKIIKYGILSLV